MSADNWAICPRCLKNAEVEKQKALESAAKAYGKATPDEWRAMTDEAAKPIDSEEFRTFREDYEFYINEDGEWSADYHGGCAKCKLEFTFKKTEQLPI